MAVAKDLSNGDVFAGYRIESLIGRGGMGVVYLAEHLLLQRKVALKLLTPELAADEGFRQRFIRESRAAASLDHPNVIPIHEAGEVDELLYLSMRYVSGSDLKGVIEREGPLPLERTINLLRQAASALDAAHAEDLVHRDVKPQNMMVSRNSTLNTEHVYLTDFGLTKHLESKTHLTATGTFMGSLDYCSPEQIEGKDVDGRTDVYSLGCVLFECLSGTVPFDKGTGPSVIYAHMSEAPPSLSEVRTTAPQGLDPVIAKAMAKNPQERYATCGELIDAAAETLRGGTKPAATIPAPPPPEGPTGTVISGTPPAGTVVTPPVAPGPPVVAPVGAGPVAGATRPSLAALAQPGGRNRLLIIGGAVLLVLLLAVFLLTRGGTDATLTGAEFPARTVSEFPDKLVPFMPKEVQGAPLSGEVFEITCNFVDGAEASYSDNRGFIDLEVCPFKAVQQADAEFKASIASFKESDYELVTQGTIELPEGQVGKYAEMRLKGDNDEVAFWTNGTTYIELSSDFGEVRGLFASLSF